MPLNNYQAIIDGAAQTVALLNAKDLAIQQLQQNAEPTYIFPALQLAPWELLWGVGRSRPVNNPAVHGKATWTSGSPATVDFQPVSLLSDCDNLYMLRRLGAYVPFADLQMASNFTYSITLAVSDLGAVQALELDYQRQIGPRIWSMGYQLFPASPQWQIRAFDYTKKSWIDTGLKLDPALLAPGKTLAIYAEFSCDGQSETHQTLTLNGGPKQQVNFTQPVFFARNSLTEFNVAVQLDAHQIAKPYVATLGDVTVALQG